MIAGSKSCLKERELLPKHAEWGGGGLRMMLGAAYEGRPHVPIDIDAVAIRDASTGVLVEGLPVGDGIVVRRVCVLVYHSLRRLREIHGLAVWRPADGVRNQNLIIFIIIFVLSLGRLGVIEQEQRSWPAG